MSMDEELKRMKPTRIRTERKDENEQALDKDAWYAVRAYKHRMGY